MGYRMSTDQEIADKVADLIREFKAKFDERTSDPDHFMTMGELESMWGKLQGDTNILYSKLMQDLLRNVDERALVRKKKESLPPSESNCEPTDEPSKNS